MFCAPSHAGLPHLETMLDDIPYSLAQIARHLDIKESTLKTYKRQGFAPRAIMLALFWETKWGQSLAHTDAHNRAVSFAGQVRGLQEQIKRMAGIIWRLETEIDRSTVEGIPANLPIFNTN